MDKTIFIIQPSEQLTMEQKDQIYQRLNSIGINGFIVMDAKIDIITFDESIKHINL